MTLINIVGYKNIYYVEDDRIKDLVENKSIDLNGPKFKKWNKTNSRGDFSLYIRVSKSIPGEDGKKKQHSKKKQFHYENETLKEALKQLQDEPDKMLATLKPQIEKKIEAEAEAKKKKELEKQNERTSVENKILNDVWDEFYEEKTNGIGKQWRKNTQRTTKVFYETWIRNSTLGSTPISEIKKPDVLNMVGSVAKVRAKRTSKSVVDLLRPMFNWYFDLHEIDRRNPASIEFADLKNSRNVVIDIDQANRLYKALDDYEIPEIRNFFQFMKTGRRQNELLTLRMENVDLKKGTFTIIEDHNKAKIDMTYVLRPELLDVLPDRKTGYVFASFNSVSKPLAEGTIRPHWKKVLERAKLVEDFKDIGGLHMHDIRHVIGKILRDAEVPRESRGLVLGHSDKQYITDRYSVRNPQTANRAYQFFLDLVYKRVPSSTLWTDL